MIENRVKALWQAGKPVLNGWLSIANAFSAEIMAAQGYDAITVDMQHGVIDYQAAVGMFQAVRASSVVPFARVPWLDPAHVMKALDAGAYGVICPMVSTPEQAAQFVSYVRYPPQGSRSFGPTRANFSAGPNYASEANDQVVCLAMIETREAVEALEGIVATPGLDGVYIGPADLTMGLFGTRFAPGFDRQEPEMIEVIKRVAATAHKAGKRAGLHNGTPDYAAKAVDWGFDLVTVSNDVRMLAGAANASVARFRELTDKGTSAEAAAATGY